MIPRPGEIYEGYLDASESHPVIVVSREELNRGDYTVVVPLTSKKFEARRHLPNCTPFRAGEYGLSKDCVALGELITVAHKSQLVLEAGPTSVLDDESMRDVIRAIGYVIGAEFEPV